MAPRVMAVMHSYNHRGRTNVFQTPTPAPQGRNRFKTTQKVILILLGKHFCFYEFESTFVINPKLKLKDLKVCGSLKKI